MPSTITNYIYDVNQDIKLNSRDEILEIKGEALGNETITLTEFPNTFVATVPGKYTVTQYKWESGNLVDVNESFYVKIPDSESNIVAEVDSLDNPHFMIVEKNEEIDNTDIIFYFALALVALLFAEWWLHTREQY